MCGGGVFSQSILRLMHHGKQISAHSSRLMMNEQWQLSQECIFISVPDVPVQRPPRSRLRAPLNICQTDPMTTQGRLRLKSCRPDGFMKFTLGVS